jgi:hypothetical protein
MALARFSVPPTFTTAFYLVMKRYCILFRIYLALFTLTATEPIRVAN